jgi:hypothetical protein
MRFAYTVLAITVSTAATMHHIEDAQKEMLVMEAAQ